MPSFAVLVARGADLHSTLAYVPPEREHGEAAVFIVGRMFAWDAQSPVVWIFSTIGLCLLDQARSREDALQLRVADKLDVDQLLRLATSILRVVPAETVPAGGRSRQRSLIEDIPREFRVDMVGTGALHYHDAHCRAAAPMLRYPARSMTATLQTLRGSRAWRVPSQSLEQTPLFRVFRVFRVFRSTVLLSDHSASMEQSQALQMVT
jgi:hypothetical protein